MNPIKGLGNNIVACLFLVVCIPSCNGAVGLWNATTSHEIQGGHVVKTRCYGLGIVNRPMARLFFLGSHVSEMVFTGNITPSGDAAGLFVRLPGQSPIKSNTTLMGLQMACTPSFTGCDLGLTRRTVTVIPATESVVLTTRQSSATMPVQHAIHHQHP
ncbi:MAG TPA: hypothetical protein VGE39_13440 [Prosthecobacter sp.]